MPAPTKAALEAWLQARGTEEGPLFVNFDRAGKGGRLTGPAVYFIVRRLGTKVGLTVRPHGLRCFFGGAARGRLRGQDVTARVIVALRDG